MRNIGRMRRFLSADTCKQTVNASVTSRLDFCNALLVGSPESTVGKLQRCQNMAARIISCINRHQHVTPVLKKLHWLPVVHRVQFKVLLQVYKALHGLMPRCLAELIQPYRPGRALRSATDSHLLHESRVNNTWGERAFSRAVEPASTGQ